MPNRRTHKGKAPGPLRGIDAAADPIKIALSPPPVTVRLLPAGPTAAYPIVPAPTAPAVRPGSPIGLQAVVVELLAHLDTPEGLADLAATGGVPGSCFMNPVVRAIGHAVGTDLVHTTEDDRWIVVEKAGTKTVVGLPDAVTGFLIGAER